MRNVRYSGEALHPSPFVKLRVRNIITVLMLSLTKHELDAGPGVKAEGSGHMQIPSREERENSLFGRRRDERS